LTESAFVETKFQNPDVCDVYAYLEGLRVDGLPVPPPRTHFTMVDVEAA